ncbi:disease resistance-like protein DSC1 [Morus notabilis]|nr:disease resistance-like protein DSC1 [Morus notabilis]
MAASSSAPKQTYDVFISFRGEDTRHNFTGHFYAALRRKKVRAYIDEDRLEKGEEISPSLLNAIEESKISVLIFSKNYASSSWCLTELAHILRCKVVNKQLVVPIFYHVDPSDIRQQRNSYAAAFAKHEKRFEDEKVQMWRSALKEAGNMCGWNIDFNRSESEVIEEIVKDILNRLDNTSSKDEFKDLVGIDIQVQNIKLLLHFSLLDVRIVGLWGMGGIGKTTLVEVIFSRFAPQFESCCFLRNIKETKRHKLHKLRKKLFSELLKEKIVNVNQFVRDRLQRTKVLVVLDDVDDVEQLEYLVRDRDWFGQGSRIIITTRDKQVLTNIEADGIYEVDELNSHDALQLFYASAFKGNSPSPVYVEMSKRVVTEYAKGVPLALKVLGCHLCSKSIEEWESELKRLENIPYDKVQNVLKMSYDGLCSEEKNIFLDIVFFFIGMKQDDAKRILDSHRWGVAMGISVLIDRSLLTIDRSNQLSMHDLVQDMGKEIVRQESPNEPGRRSRLWFAEDVCSVLKNNTATPEIQGMSLDMSKIRAAICMSPRLFEAMPNLKFLRFFDYVEEKLKLQKKGLKCLPSELRFLHWDSFPLKRLPPKFWPQNLIELHLINSKLEKLWDDVQHIVSLKVLNLEGSKKLTEIPDLSLALNLEKINLRRCIHLKRLPGGIGKLELLQVLRLSGCSNIDEFPELPKNIQRLHMDGTAIENVPPSIERLSQLLVFNLTNCKRLESLPTNFSKLKSLEELYVGGCLALNYLPEIKEPMEHLTVLQTQEARIRKLPSSTEKLDGITKLFIQHTRVPEIPDWLFSLPGLDLLNLRESNTIRIPESIKSSKLKYLQLRDCKFLKSLPELPLSIQAISVEGCISLEKVSNSWNLLAQAPKGDRPFPMRFSFEGCLKLDHKDVITEFQIRSLFYASIQQLLKHKGQITLSCETMRRPHLDAGFRASLTQKGCRFEKERHVTPLRVIVSYPGDEIPEWFSYQNVGDSIDMMVPTEYTNFLGFAFCFVVENAHNDDSYNVENLYWEIYLKTNSNGERRIQHLSKSMYFGGSYDLNHVLMTTHLAAAAFVCDPVTEMSFHFSFEDPLKRKIKSCGMRLLSLQDAIEFGIISDQYVFSEANVVVNELQPSGFLKNVIYPLFSFQGFPSRQQLCEKILSFKILPRHKTLWLLLVLDCLPVREVVNYQVDLDTTCPLCGLVSESATHLFLYCQSVGPLWFMSRWGLKTNSLCCDSMASFLELVLFGDPNSLCHFDGDFLLYASVLLETIWLARNGLVHEEKTFDIADIHSSVQAQFNEITAIDP